MCSIPSKLESLQISRGQSGTVFPLQARVWRQTLLEVTTVESIATAFLWVEAGLLLNILQCRAAHHQQKMICPHMSIMLRRKNFTLDFNDILILGLPWWLRGRPGFDPRVGKILPWRRRWHLTPVFSPGKSNGWRNLGGCSPSGCKQ